MNGLNLIDDQEKFRHGMEVFLNPPDFSVGTTPSEIIFREDKMKHIHYTVSGMKKMFSLNR